MYKRQIAQALCIDKLKEAYHILYEATKQSHRGHWDREGTHGKNCPECIRAEVLRKKANKIFEEAAKIFRV